MGESYTNQHAVVLAGMDIEFTQKSQTGELRVKSLHVFDPYPEHAERIYSPPLYYSNRVDSEFAVLPGKVANTILVDITPR